MAGKVVALAMDIPVADRRMARIRSRSKEMGTVQEPLIPSATPSGLGPGETCRSLSRTALVRMCLCLGLIAATALVGIRFSSTNIVPFQHDAFITITGTQVRAVGGTLLSGLSGTQSVPPVRKYWVLLSFFYN